MTQEHYLAMAALPTGAICGWMLCEFTPDCAVTPERLRWIATIVWAIGMVGILGLAQ